MLKYLRLMLCMGATVCAYPAYAVEVLLLWDDSPGTVPPENRPPLLEDLNIHTQALVNALEADGISVTFSRDPHFAYDGETPLPADFDVIVHLNGDIDPEEFDDVPGPGAVARMEQYVRDGGGYVGSENNALQIDSGTTRLRNLTPIEYVPEIPPNDGPLVIAPVTGQASHPLFNGLIAPITISGSYIASQLRTSYTTFPAELIAEDAEGNAAIAVRELDEGRVVGFHHRGNYAGPNTFAPTLSNATVQQLYINAVRWADQRPPRVDTIELPAPAVNGDNVTFIVRFTESVTGVDAGDFEFTPLALDVTGPITVTPLSGKDYEVSVAGASGSGLVHIDLIDNNSIEDESVSATPLAGGSNANGNFTGPDLFVDTLAPSVQSVAALPLGGGSGTTPTIVIEFNDLMMTSVSPTITLTAPLGGIIPLGTGAWTSSSRYEVPVGRVLTNNDGGLISFSITGAKDFVGNTMTPYNASPIFFPTVGLTVSISPSGIVQRSIGSAVTFAVGTSGVTGDVVYEWKKQTPGKAIESIGDNLPTLTLLDLQPEDAAIYYCVVTDNIDTIETPHVQLRIVAALPAANVAMLLAAAMMIAVVGALVERRQKSPVR